MSKNKDKKSWRDYWVVRNILGELPFVGGFFQHKKITEALYHVGKSTCMIVGGTSAMILSMMIGAHKDEGMGAKCAEMTGCMLVGMFSGKILFNGIHGIGTKMVACHKEKRIAIDQVLLLKHPNC